MEKREPRPTMLPRSAFNVCDALEKGDGLRRAVPDSMAGEGCSSLSSPENSRRGSSDLPPTIPAKIGSRCYRYIRWNFLSVYRRLFTFVFVANMAILSV